MDRICEKIDEVNIIFENCEKMCYFSKGWDL